MFVVTTDNPKDLVARVAHAARIGATLMFRDLTDLDEQQKQQGQQEFIKQHVVVAVVPRALKQQWRNMLFAVWSYVCYSIPQMTQIKQTFAVASIEAVSKNASLLLDAKPTFVVFDFADMSEVMHAEVLRKLVPAELAGLVSNIIIMSERPIVATTGTKIISRLPSSTSMTYALEHAFVAVPAAAPVACTKSGIIKDCAATDDIEYKHAIKFRVLGDALVKQTKKTAQFLIVGQDGLDTKKSAATLAQQELERAGVRNVAAVRADQDAAVLGPDTNIVILEFSNTTRIFQPQVLRAVRAYVQSRSGVHLWIDVADYMSVDVLLYVASIVYQPSIVDDASSAGPATITYLVTTPAISGSDKRVILANTERAVRLCLQSLQMAAGSLQALRFMSMPTAVAWPQDTSAFVNQTSTQIEDAGPSKTSTEDVVVFFQFVAKFMKTQSLGYYRDAGNYVSRVAQQDMVVAVPATTAAAEIVTGTAPVSLKDASRTRDLTGPADEAMVAAARHADDDDPATLYINGSMTLEDYLRQTIVDRIVNRAQLPISSSASVLDLDSDSARPWSLDDLSQAEDLAAAIKQRRDALYQSAENPIIDCLNESIMAETGIVDKLIGAVGQGFEQPLTGETLEPMAAAYAANTIIGPETEVATQTQASDEQLLNHLVALPGSVRPAGPENGADTWRAKLVDKFTELRDLLKTALLGAKEKYLAVVESVSSTETSILDQAMAQVSKMIPERQEKLSKLAAAAVKNYGFLKKSQAQQLQALIPEMQRLEFEVAEFDKDIGAQAVDLADDLAAGAIAGAGSTRIQRRIEERKLYEAAKRAEAVKLRRLQIAQKVESIVSKFEDDRAEIIKLFENTAAAEKQSARAEISAVLAPVSEIFARNKDKLNPEIEVALNDYASAVLAARSQYLSQQRQTGREYYISHMTAGALSKDIDDALQLNCDVAAVDQVALENKQQKLKIEVELDDELAAAAETKEQQQKQQKHDEHGRHNVYLLSVVSEYLNKWVSSYHFTPARALESPDDLESATELKTFYQALMYHTYYEVLRAEPKTPLPEPANIVFKSVQANMDPGTILNDAIAEQESINGVDDMLTVGKLSQLLHYWYDAIIKYVYKQMRALRRSDPTIKTLLWSRDNKDAAAAERSKVAVAVANLFAHRACIRIESDLTVALFLQVVVVADVDGSEIKTHAMTIIGGPTNASEKLAATEGCWLIMNSTDSVEPSDDEKGSAAAEAELFVVYPVLYTAYESDENRDTTNTKVAVSTKVLQRSFINSGGARLA